jgi:hypothetical protein
LKAFNQDADIADCPPSYQGCSSALHAQGYASGEMTISGDHSCRDQRVALSEFDPDGEFLVLTDYRARAANSRRGAGPVIPPNENKRLHPQWSNEPSWLPDR